MNTGISNDARDLLAHIDRVLLAWHERLSQARSEEDEEYVIAWYQLAGASEDMRTVLRKLARLEEHGEV